MLNRTRAFLADESGAITKDWVVITALLVGLGLVVMASMSGGLESQSGDVSSTLGGTPIQSRFARVTGFDFSGGAGGWAGGVVTDEPGLGGVLRVEPGETVTRTMAFAAGTMVATISFDLASAGLMDGDYASIRIDGQEVARYTQDGGRVSHVAPTRDGIDVEVREIESGVPLPGGVGTYNRSRYTLRIDDPPETFNLDVTTGAGETIAEEFFAIDDMEIRQY